MLLEDMRFLFRAQSSAAEQFKQLVSHLFQIHSYANKAAPASGLAIVVMHVNVIVNVTVNVTVTPTV